MTEQERLEKISEGKLWYDTDEYLAHQAKVKDLMYDFNMSKPSETEKKSRTDSKNVRERGKGCLD